MTKIDAVDRDLAVLRAAITPTAAAKRRVRRGLVQASSTEGLLPAHLRRSASWKTFGLIGVSLVVGYWLGLERALEFDPPRPRAVTVASNAAPESGPAPPASLESPLGGEPASEPSPEDRGTVGEAPSPPVPDAVVARRDMGHGPSALTRRQASRHAPLPAAADRTRELLLLQRAERAIRAGEGALALSLVAELEERHPRTLFGEERSATRVLAVCLLGEPLARARAEAFLEARPISVYSDRVRKLCGVDRASTVTGRAAPVRGDGSAELEH